MNNEELELYVKKSCENVFKKLAENPKEMLNLSDLQEKYNNLLKEKIELKRQIKKQKEAINKAIEYINNHDLTCNENWLVQYEKELLDILKEVE